MKESNTGQEAGDHSSYIRSLTSRSEQNWLKFSIQKADFAPIERTLLSDISSEGCGLEIDFGSQDFQRLFFARYLLVRSSEFPDEHSKSQNVRIKMLARERTVELTRSRLDSLLTHFRKIYRSFCDVKSFMAEAGRACFDRAFHFETFLLLEESFPFVLLVKPAGDALVVEASPYAHRQPDPVPLDQNSLRLFLFALFNQSLFATFQASFPSTELSQARAIQTLARGHLELFDFLLKVKVLPQNGFGSKLAFKTSTKVAADS